MTGTTFTIILLILLTLASGYYSGSEAALFSLSQTKLKTYRNSSDKRKRLIAELVLQPRDLLVTVFMLNVLVNILLQNVASHMFGKEAGWDLKVGVPLAITLIFGEIIPKNIGMQHNEKFSMRVVNSIYFAHRILGPVRKWMIAIVNPVSKFLFFFLKQDESISSEEMHHVLKTSQEHGVLSNDEAQLVYGYLNLQESTIKEMMRPREDVIFYDIHEPLSKLVHLFVDQEVTRIPVCDGTFDQVIGMLTATEFFLHKPKVTSNDQLQRILKKPFYVPENTLAKTLLIRFNEMRQEIAVVVDEYGSISGLISREDLAEEIVGEITDMRDQKALYTRAGPNELIASGKLELDLFNELFETELKSKANMVTIGGWLIEQLDNIPISGQKYENDQFLFQVLAATPKRIKRLYVRKLRGSHS